MLLNQMSSHELHRNTVHHRAGVECTIYREILVASKIWRNGQKSLR